MSVDLYLYAFQKFRDIAAFVLLHTTFPSDTPIVSSDFSHIPLEVGRWPLCIIKEVSLRIAEQQLAD